MEEKNMRVVITVPPEMVEAVEAETRRLNGTPAAVVWRTAMKQYLLALKQPIRVKADVKRGGNRKAQS